jgi:ABC-type sugar transport system ATPase subunit
VLAGSLVRASAAGVGLGQMIGACSAAPRIGPTIGEPTPRVLAPQATEHGDHVVPVEPATGIAIENVHRTILNEKKKGKAIVLISTELSEIFALSDRIAVMKGGYLEQLGTPDDVYSRPASRFVAGFIGSPTMNFVDAPIGAAGSTIRLKSGVTLAGPAGRHAELAQLAGRSVVFGIRPEHLSFGAHGPDVVGVATKASMVEPLGSDTLVTLSLDGAEMTARFPPEAGVRVGDTVELGIAMSRFHLFDPESGQALAVRPKL